MMARAVRLAGLALLLALTGFTRDAVAQAPAPNAASPLAGQWLSDTCEALQSTSGSGATRNFAKRGARFTDREWLMDVTVFGDPACQIRLFSVRIEGDYMLGQASVQGSREIVLRFQRKSAAAHDPAIAGAFNKARCGVGDWLVEIPKDISRTGCITTRPINEDCLADYDIVRVEGNKMRFGQRQTNLCRPELRPKQLSPYALERK